MDIYISLTKVLKWKKDPNMNLEDSMQQLHHLCLDLNNSTNGGIHFDESLIISFFLNGLPKKYDSIKFSILASHDDDNGPLSIRHVLSVLQLQESMEDFSRL